MYVSGDTVDFQFGADPKADREADRGRGRRLPHLDRQLPGPAHGRVVSQGVGREAAADVHLRRGAAVRDGLRGRDRRRPDRGAIRGPTSSGYVVEAAIPWASLGFVPQPGVLYRGDVGVTHGTATGDRTRLRTYWSNQETGLVDDAVFELKMTPKNWGQIVFKP